MWDILWDFNLPQEKGKQWNLWNKWFENWRSCRFNTATVIPSPTLWESWCHPLPHFENRDVTLSYTLRIVMSPSLTLWESWCRPLSHTLRIVMRSLSHTLRIVISSTVPHFENRAVNPSPTLSERWCNPLSHNLRIVMSSRLPHFESRDAFILSTYPKSKLSFLWHIPHFTTP